MLIPKKNPPCYSVLAPIFTVIMLITNTLKLNTKSGSLLRGISPQSISKPQPFQCLTKSVMLHDSSIFSRDKPPECSSSVSSPAHRQPWGLISLPWSATVGDRQEGPSGSLKSSVRNRLSPLQQWMLSRFGQQVLNPALYFHVFNFASINNSSCY